MSDEVGGPRIDHVSIEPAQTLVENGAEPPLPLESWTIKTGNTPLAKQHMLGYELHRDAGTWLVGNGNDFGYYSLEGVSTLEIGRLEGLFHGYSVHFLGGPVQTDLPPRLFELFLGYRAIGDFNHCWGYDVSVSPGIYTDFEGHAHQGWRIRGLALAKYRYTPTTSFVFGVAYLDRENLKMLPVGGLVIELNEITKLELMFPEPRVTTIINHGKSSESTLYARGQLGGGSWAIERKSLLNDIATYEDFRAFVGWSLEDDDGESTFFEVGYVFKRTLQYRSGIGDMLFNETVMFRSGVRY